MSRYLELEKRADDLAHEIKHLAEGEVTPESRDKVMQMTGERNILTEQARALRDAEVEELRAAAERGREVGGETATKQAQDDFRAFVKTGEARASMSMTDGNGGYLVPEPVHEAMIDLVFKASPIMQNARVYNMTGDTKIYIPKKTAHSAVGWVAETAARTETNSMTLGNVSLEAFELYANAYATQAVLDTVAGAEQLITEDIAGAIAEEANAKFCDGNGSTQPTGIWSTAAQSIYTTVLSGTNDLLDASSFFKAYTSLPAKFLGNAKWYMEPAELAKIAQLAYSTAVTSFPLVEWRNGTAFIHGKEVVLVDDAPSAANGAFPGAFGDMAQGYAVGVHKQLSVLRDPYSAKPYVTFYCLTRIGGVPTDPKALLLLKSDAS